MARVDFLVINIVGLIISAFSIYVTISLFQKYRLRRTLGFVFTAVNIFLWNVAHVAYDLVPSSSYEVARGFFVLANVSGLFIILGTLFVFSSLRNENLSFNLVFYVFVSGMFLSAILTQTEWIDIIYNSTNQSWNSEPFNGIFWGLYSVVLLIMLVIELYLPLGRYFVSVEGPSRKYALYLIILALIGPLANAFLPVILAIGFPPVSRYLLTNLAFLGIFWIFLRHPFVGFIDRVEVHQVLVSNTSGMPIFSTEDLTDAALATGALHGINTILDEITGKIDFIGQEKGETRRKIELTEDRFFIIKVKDVINIFHYSNHSGVCLSKFTSLGRIFREDEVETLEKLAQFQEAFVEYYPKLEEKIMKGYITVT